MPGRRFGILPDVSRPGAPIPRSLLAIIALVMSAVAGYIDAVGYLTLVHIYVANMSGNSVALGAALGRLHWREAAYRGFPVLMFLAGLMAGGVIIEIGRRRNLPRAFAAAMVIELVCLLAFGVIGQAAAPHA